MFHITNGDIAADLVTRSGVGGAVLAWRDILTDGPVPGGHPLEALSEIRAKFLGQAFGDAEETRRALAGRDTDIRRAAAGTDEVVLWFENDLYDQLQLLQVLDVLADGDSRPTVSLIEIDSRPDIEHFHGLGQLTPEQLAALLPQRTVLGEEHFALARQAWAAVTAEDPTALDDLRIGDLSALPFLAAALRRHVEEFPWTTDGLSRTERQILKAVGGGIAEPRALYNAVQAAEEVPFLSDWCLWRRVEELCAAPHRLIACSPERAFRHPPKQAADDAFHAQRLKLTEVGRAVLAGTADELAINGIDRWYGGAYFAGGRPHWRWDPTQHRLIKYLGRNPA